MSQPCYLWELCDLEDPVLRDFLIKVAGMSLMPPQPQKRLEVIEDEKNQTTGPTKTEKENDPVSR